jgi:hypothetical protein
MEIAQAGKQRKYEIRRKKFVKGMPKTQQLDYKAGHGKSQHESLGKKGLLKF